MAKANAVWSRFLTLSFQHPLDRRADRFIGAMYAAQPATRAALALKQFFTRSLDAPLPGFNLFGVNYPADELVARKWRNILPERKYFSTSK